MKLNEWAIFIKESRDWHANKCHSIDNHLIESHDVDEDVIAVIIDLFRHLFDDSMRMLLTFRVSMQCHI